MHVCNGIVQHHNHRIDYFIWRLLFHDWTCLEYDISFSNSRCVCEGDTNAVTRLGGVWCRGDRDKINWKSFSHEFSNIIQNFQKFSVSVVANLVGNAHLGLLTAVSGGIKCRL